MTLYAVSIRRQSSATVFVDNPDPREALRIAVEKVTDADFVDEPQQQAAYPWMRDVTDRWWNGGDDGHWVWPEQPLEQQGEQE